MDKNVHQSAYIRRGTVLLLVLTLLVQLCPTFVFADSGDDMMIGTAPYEAQGGCLITQVNEPVYEGDTLPRTNSLICPLITSSFSCTIFSYMVCRLLSEWCVATSFYQSSANHVSFYAFFNLRNLLYLIYPNLTCLNKYMQ